VEGVVLVMKFRKGFVSNSSSYSYVCAVCGEIATYDTSEIDQYGIYPSCKDMICSRHVEEYCNAHGLEDDLRAYVERGELSGNVVEEYDEDSWYYEMFEREFPKQFDPLYNLHAVSDNDVMKYLLKVAGVSKEQTVKDIQKMFKNYEELQEYLK